MHDHHQPLPFIKGVKNKQGIVLAEHSDPLLPIPMNGIAGLDMALACKADKVAFVTKLTVEDEVITFTGLDHIKDSFACLIKIKSGGDWLGAIFATKTIDGDCTQFIQTLTDYYIRTYADGEWGEWAKHTIGEGGGIELPIAISDVTGLQAALDGRASTDELHGLENIVQGLEDSKADVEHTQAISTITGLQVALKGKADSAHTQLASTITDFADSVNGLTKKSFVVNDATNPISITLVDGDIESLTTPGAWRADLAYSGFSANRGGGIFIVRSTATGEVAQMTQTFQTLITDQYIYSRQLTPMIGTWNKTLLAGANQLEIADITGLQTALDGKADASHTQAISTITGLQTALDGKLDFSILYDAMKAVYDINDMPIGHLILINQSDAVMKKKLSQMIVQTEIGIDQIHFHLNSGDLTNNFFLVRRFAYVISSVTHHFIEVVGAWD